jgi:hypothetical protein
MNGLTIRLRMVMLRCTVVKGKIIVVDNWGGCPRMEEFIY